MEWALGLPTNPGMIALFIFVGAVGLPIGASLVVDASVGMAVHFGVDETVIGLTVLAVGTSLPELATTVVAAAQKRTDVALGTIVGSNIFNVLGILGVGALASSRPISVPSAFMSLDFPVMLGSAVMLAVFAWLRRPIGRLTGILFLLAYLAYVVMLVQRSRDIGV